MNDNHNQHSPNNPQDPMDPTVIQPDAGGYEETFAQNQQPYPNQQADGRYRYQGNHGGQGGQPRRDGGYGAAGHDGGYGGNVGHDGRTSAGSSSMPPMRGHRREDMTRTEARYEERGYYPNTGGAPMQGGGYAPRHGGARVQAVADTQPSTLSYVMFAIGGLILGVVMMWAISSFSSGTPDPVATVDPNTATPAQVADLNNQIAILHGNIDEKDKQIVTLQEELAKANTANVDSVEGIEQQSEAIKQKEAELAQKETELTVKEADLVAREEEVAKKETSSSTQVEDMAAKENNIAIRENAAAAKESKANAALAKITTFNEKAQNSALSASGEAPYTAEELQTLVQELNAILQP